MKSAEIRKMCVGRREIKRSKYLLEIVPTSCTHFDNLKSFDDKIEGPYQVQGKEKDLAGTIQRTFPCKLYRIQVNNLKYIYDRTICYVDTANSMWIYLIQLFYFSYLFQL